MQAVTDGQPFAINEIEEAWLCSSTVVDNRCVIACAHQLHFRQTLRQSIDLLREHIADAFLVQNLSVVAIDPDQILADDVQQGIDEGLAIASAIQ